MNKPKRRNFAVVSWRGLLLVSTTVLTFQLGITSNHDWIRYRRTTHEVEHTYQILVAVERLRNSVEDADTGQRGYLLTGEQRYLEPYSAALSRITASEVKLQQLAADDSLQQARLVALRQATETKLAELRQTIELRRTSGLAAALEVVHTDRGQQAMDEIRRIADRFQEDEHGMLGRSTEAETQAVRSRARGA